MRTSLRTLQAVRTRRAIRRNAAELTASLIADPWDFDAREHLWMERDRLARTLTAAGGSMDEV